MTEDKNLFGAPAEHGEPEETVKTPAEGEQTSAEQANVPAEGEQTSAEQTQISTESENIAEQTEEFTTGSEKNIQETADPSTEGESASPAPAWRFTPVPEEKGGARRFAAVFALVFGLTVLLLIGAMFLGQSGFHFVQHVNTERTVYVREYDPASGLLTPNEAADRARQFTVAVSVRTPTGATIGSGFVWREDGYILTNHHVVENASAVQVMFASGEAVDATVVGSNADADVAVLHVDRTGLAAAPIGQSSLLLTGDDVVAVGTPAQLDFAGTATFGKVSHPARIMTFADDTGVISKKMTLIQTDTSVNPGNSGGPLVDMYGRVVGIVVMKVMTVAGTNYDGIGFAIPIDGAVTVAEGIVRDGAFTGVNPIAAPRTLLGVSARGLAGGKWYSDPTAETLTSSDTATAECTFHMPTDGVFVMNVNDGGAVGKIAVGDIMTRIEGLRMYTVYDVIAAVNRRQPGETVTVTLLRQNGGEWQERTVEILLTAEH